MDGLPCGRCMVARPSWPNSNTHFWVFQLGGRKKPLCCRVVFRLSLSFQPPPLSRHREYSANKNPDNTYKILIIMLMNTIEWKPKAVKQLRKVPAQANAAIRQSVNEEIDLESARNVTRLSNHEFGYRLRAGNYRVLFDYEGGAACIVSIEEEETR